MVDNCASIISFIVDKLLLTLGYSNSKAASKPCRLDVAVNRAHLIFVSKALILNHCNYVCTGQNIKYVLCIIPWLSGRASLISKIGYWQMGSAPFRLRQSAVVQVIFEDGGFEANMTTQSRLNVGSLKQSKI